MSQTIITSTDIHNKLANSYNSFPEEVKKAARYVMDHPAEIPLYSIRNIAIKADVNPSTMVRLIKLLNFSRYEEFKSIYKTAASKLPVSNFTLHAEQLLNQSGNQFFGEHEAVAYKAMANAFNDKTYEGIDLTTSHILKAQRVYILGMRGSFSMAFYLHYVLHFMLPEAHLIRGQEGMLLSEISHITNKDVVLVFGASPLSQETTNALDKIKSKKPVVIVATDEYTSSASTHADIVIALGNETLNFMPSLLPYIAFSELLVSRLIAKGGKKMLVRIREFEEELAKMNAYVRPNK
jgi:DNA-binding MurR/RpiR family transcriptional regulator